MDNTASHRRQTGGEKKKLESQSRHKLCSFVLVIPSGPVLFSSLFMYTMILLSSRGSSLAYTRINWMIIFPVHWHADIKFADFYFYVLRSPPNDSYFTVSMNSIRVLSFLFSLDYNSLKQLNIFKTLGQKCLYRLITNNVFVSTAFSVYSMNVVVRYK